MGLSLKKTFANSCSPILCASGVRADPTSSKAPCSKAKLPRCFVTRTSVDQLETSVRGLCRPACPAHSAARHRERPSATADLLDALGLAGYRGREPLGNWCVRA